MASRSRRLNFSAVTGKTENFQTAGHISPPEGKISAVTGKTGKFQAPSGSGAAPSR